LAYTDVKILSHETIRRTLKKTKLSLGRAKEWRIPPKETEEFVEAMEDILDVYTWKHDKKHHMVCADEFIRQLIGEERTPIPLDPEKPARFDTEYRRNGICEVFMFVALS